MRRARLADLELLVEHRRRMWEDMGKHQPSLVRGADAPYRKWARARLRDGMLVGWVATSGRAAVASGCVWLQPVQPRPGDDSGLRPYLLSMFTEPAWRGRGIARRIVREAMRWARREGHGWMSLHASDAGRSVYEGLGFERTSEMWRRLAPPR